MSKDFNAAKARGEIVDSLVETATTPRYEGGHPSVDPDDEEAVAFIEVALENIVEQLVQNIPSLEKESAYQDVSGVLRDENVDHIELHRNGLHSPTVRVWLTDCPIWANTAFREEFKFSAHREHYNGNPAHAVLDCRPV